MDRKPLPTSRKRQRTILYCGCRGPADDSQCGVSRLELTLRGAIRPLRASGRSSCEPGRGHTAVGERGGQRHFPQVNRCRLDPELLERITARCAELDGLEEQLAKQLAEVRAERDELAVAERVLERMSEQLADERASVAPVRGQVGGRAADRRNCSGSSRRSSPPTPTTPRCSRTPPTPAWPGPATSSTAT